MSSKVRGFSSLQSAPTASVVAPGNCAFGTEWAPSKLVSKEKVSHDSILLTFALPEDRALGLSTCACILASSGIKDSKGQLVVRPYTPVSTNDLKSSFQLLVKVYPQGLMSQSLSNLEPGEEASFKHIAPNVKVQYPFGKKKIGMLVGGTGITPMLQALHAILGTPDDTTQVSMLYGNRTSADILANELLAKWEGASDRLSITHVLSEEKEDSVWKGLRGFIDEDAIKNHLPGPSEDCLLMVCGPPPMYAALCGARDQPEVTGLLGGLGYSSDQVYKF